MGKIDKNELFSHVQKFVREVYAEQLKEAGFHSYRDEGVHWFRLVNDEVIQTVYFVTRHTTFPITLYIEYGCHPLFIPPILQHSPYMYGMPGYEQMYDVIQETIPGRMPHGRQRSMVQGMTNRCYREDVLVECPVNPDERQQILHNVLAEIEPLSTPEACFEAHKRWRAREIENDAWLTMSPYFVEEVLYWEDKSLYPYCMEYMRGRIEWFSGLLEEGKLALKYQQELEYLKVLWDVFQNNSRTEYLRILYERKIKNLKRLKSNTSIT